MLESFHTQRKCTKEEVEQNRFACYICSAYRSHATILSSGLLVAQKVTRNEGSSATNDYKTTSGARLL